MRTIKFRGKRVDNGERVYGYFARFAHGEIPVILEETESELKDYKVIPDTVGQFTGLLDNKGNDIYEGDIVANDFGNAYIVNMTVEWCTDGYWALHEIDGDDTMHFVADYLKEIEIIGNIHDNPELLTLNK